MKGYLMKLAALILVLFGVSVADDQAMNGMNGMDGQPPTSGVNNENDEPHMNGNEMSPVDMMGGKFLEKKLLKYLQPINVGRNLTYDDLSKSSGYLCTRDCCLDSKPRLCYFQFTVEQYTAMGPACKNCTYGNVEDCVQQQCITADGIERMVYSINRMIPGPTINVCAGDRIVVDVLNTMTSASLTFHWHGVLQKKSPWMDGVPMLTQCPINPMALFRYDFVVDELGTYFYHSHTGNIQRDGLYGILVVKHCNDPQRETQYDLDLPSHSMIIGDWSHLPSDNYFPGYYLNETMSPPIIKSYLINGRGSYQDSVTQTTTPHQTFHVKSGSRYLFRIIGATFANCLFQLGIQDHSMTVVALDGYPDEPVVVNTLVMGSGTRTDVVIDTRNKPGDTCSYYIVVKGMDECANINPQTAYLVYDDCDPTPTTEPDFPTIYDKAPYLDHVTKGCELPDVFCSFELRGIDNASPRITREEPNYRFFLSLSPYLFKYDELFENEMNPYQFFYEPVGGRPPIPGGGAFIDTMNKVSGMMPPFPLLYQNNYLPEEMICHGSCTEQNATYCFCVNILEVKLNSTVELVLTDEMSGPNHPMHIHGYNWAIFKQGTRQERTENPDDFWKLTVEVDNPVVRDVIIIPSGGFVVARFIANNPGYWMLHCHFQNHMMGGMFLFLKVGENEEFLQPPKDFPRCSIYLPDISDIDNYEIYGDNNENYNNNNNFM